MTQSLTIISQKIKNDTVTRPKHSGSIPLVSSLCSSLCQDSCIRQACLSQHKAATCLCRNSNSPSRCKRKKGGVTCTQKPLLQTQKITSVGQQRRATGGSWCVRDKHLQVLSADFPQHLTMHLSLVSFLPCISHRPVSPTSLSKTPTLQNSLV